eukprot:COSAG01_NODE_42324_length_441_cov_0.906433_1_plen_53_part_10
MRGERDKDKVPKYFYVSLASLCNTTLISLYGCSYSIAAIVACCDLDEKPTLAT